MATDHSEAFDVLMASLDAPLAIVTTASGDETAGCLIGFHCQASIAPLRQAVWLSKANHTYRVALRATHLAVHLLTEDDHDLAELFGTLTGDETDKIAPHAHTSGPGGVPLLEACAHRVVLRRTVLVDEVGDHVCLMGEVVEATSTGPFRPLRLSDVGDIEPGHPNEDRPAPPTERADA